MEIEQLNTDYYIKVNIFRLGIFLSDSKYGQDSQKITFAYLFAGCSCKYALGETAKHKQVGLTEVCWMEILEKLISSGGYKNAVRHIEQLFHKIGSPELIYSPENTALQNLRAIFRDYEVKTKPQYHKLLLLRSFSQNIYTLFSISFRSHNMLRKSPNHKL